jgi:hypothetical protein
VRRVVASGELVGYLIVADIGADDSYDVRQGIARGFINAGGTTRELVVEGRNVMVGTGPNGAAAGWIEPPYLLSVFALNEDSARLLAEAVMTGYGE